MHYWFLIKTIIIIKRGDSKLFSPLTPTKRVDTQILSRMTSRL